MLGKKQYSNHGSRSLYNRYNKECSDAQPINILLVEDVSSDALLTRIALKEACHPKNIQVNTLQNGDEVLPYVLSKENAQPDLIVLDLGLPGMSGIEILQELENLPIAMRAVPIIVLSGYDILGEINHNNKLWISGRIKKPCSSDNLKQALENTPLLSVFSMPEVVVGPLTSHQRSPVDSQDNWSHMIAKIDQNQDRERHSPKVQPQVTAMSGLMVGVVFAALFISALMISMNYSASQSVIQSSSLSSAGFAAPENQLGLEKLMATNPDALAAQFNNIEPG